MRFVLFPGNVESKTDGQSHWITADQLHHLYQVGARPFIVVLGGVDQDTYAKYVPQEGDVACLPRYDGDYPSYRL